MNEISKYLEQTNPDFNQGFGLFCKYSRNQSLMSWIGRKKDMEMLKYELQKLVNMGIVTPNPHCQSNTIRFGKTVSIPQKPVVEKPENPGEATNPNTQEKFKITDERTINRDSLPEDLKLLYDANVNDYKMKRIFHEKMKNANSDLSRKEFRDELMKLESTIKGRWNIIDSTLGGKPAPSSQELINQHKSYITKILKRDTLTEDQRALVKQKFNELISAGANLKPETLKLLKEKGF